MEYPFEGTKAQRADTPSPEEGYKSGDNGAPLLPRESNCREAGAHKDKIKLALIDSRPLTRISVTHLLETSTPARRRSEDFLVFPFSSTDEFLAHPPEHCSSVHLIIFNIGAACSSEAEINQDIQRLKQDLPAIPLIILSERDERDCIMEALRHGVHSYISTTLNPKVAIQALRLILAGGTFVPTSIFPEIPGEAAVTAREAQNQNKFIQIKGLQNFTPRQVEVLQLLREGKSNKIIAYELKMQESTVKVHVRQIMKKLKAINRTHAAFLISKIIDNQTHMALEAESQ